MNLVVITVALFLALIGCLEIGYRLGAKRVKSVPNAHEGFGAIEGAVFGLFGLLLSLSFFGAASRLDVRRQLIVQEANASASAYMRVDLLPSTEQLFQANWGITWHASVGAAASCDTFLITEEGPRAVTAAEAWPLKRIKIQGAEFVRPDLLVRPPM